MKKRAILVFLLLICVLWGTSCIRDKNPFDGNGDNHQTIPSTMPQTDIPWPSLANSPWPMVHHDPQLTGRSPYSGPQQGELLWASNLPSLGLTETGVVIGPEGTLYYGCDGYTGNHLVALHPDGTEKWRYGIGFGGEQFSTPLVGVDGTIYIGSFDHHLYAINSDGTLKWKFDTGARVYQGINIGLDGTLYFVAQDSSLYAVSPQGQLVWKSKIDEGFQPYWIDAVAISPDGLTLYVPGISRNLYAIRTNGDLRWKFTTDSMFDYPLVDSQGNIYGIIRLSEERWFLYAINPEGDLRWSREFSGYLLPTVGITMGEDGFLYFVSSQSSISSVDYSGNLRWEWIKSSYGIFFDGAPVCDKDRSVYCSTGRDHFYCLSGDGVLKWELSTPEVLVRSTPAIGDDGRIYFSTGEGGATIYCVR